jgi:hypothetical protein
MYSDVRTKYGLEASLSTNNKKLWPTIKNGINIAVVCLLVYAMHGMIKHGMDVNRAMPIQEYIACDSQIHPYSRLIEMVNLTDQIRCSTQYQSQSQPCLCCLDGMCWRDYYITPFSNSTRQATVRDRLHGIVYERKVPLFAEFCYMMWNSSHYDRCIKEHKEKVAHLLRARELLYGWGPAGLVIDG